MLNHSVVLPFQVRRSANDDAENLQRLQSNQSELLKLTKGVHELNIMISTMTQKNQIIETISGYDKENSSSVGSGSSQFNKLTSPVKSTTSILPISSPQSTAAASRSRIFVPPAASGFAKPVIAPAPIAASVVAPATVPAPAPISAPVTAPVPSSLSSSSTSTSSSASQPVSSTMSRLQMLKMRYQTGRPAGAPAESK